MATGDIYTNIYNKKIMDQESLSDHFLKYLHKLIRGSQQTIYASDGFFSPVILSSILADAVSVSGSHGQDGVSNIIGPVAYSNVPFANALGVFYYVGLKLAEIPYQAEINPRTGIVEYRNIQESVGRTMPPDSLTDNGDNTITFIVDNVCEAGVSHAGRTVRVWIVNPINVVDWYEDCVVVWDGVNNKITTTGPLGQTIISTWHYDYMLWEQGPTIHISDLHSDSDYAYIGRVTGAGPGNIPAVFNYTNQNLLASDPNVALNLGTIFKDVYIDPTFPNDGNPKFSNPIEYWWKQEHNETDYTHADVTYDTLIAKILAGTQSTMQGFDLADDAIKKFLMKDHTGADTAWITPAGDVTAHNITVNNILDVLGNTILGNDSSDTLSVLAYIISDLVMDNGFAISPAIDWHSAGAPFASIKNYRNGNDLYIARNDANAAESILRILNSNVAGGVLNVLVQGDLKGANGVSQINRTGDVLIGDASVSPSPYLKFLQTGYSPITARGVGNVLEVRGTVNTPNKLILEILNDGTGTAAMKAWELIISGTPGILSATNILQFKDVDTPAAIPFSSPTDTALVTTKQNIIGAINEVATSPINHIELGDMPDISGTNSDHDGRYFTKPQLGNQGDAALGTYLIGHANLNNGAWENIRAKGVIDDLCILLNSNWKPPLPIYFNGTHASIPAQAINCKGFIRQNTSDLSLSWSDLDSGVDRLAYRAYYVYAVPATSPLKTFSGKISNVAPVRGFHTASGKERWMYMGAFVTDGSQNVVKFYRVENIVKVPRHPNPVAHGGAATDVHMTCVEGAEYVVPKTAKMIILSEEMTGQVYASAGSASIWWAPVAPATTNWGFTDVWAGNAGSGEVHANHHACMFTLELGSDRDYYVTNTYTGGASVISYTWRVGWVEDLMNGMLT